ncbi:MAG: sugar ABC transporter permease [Verrucomicrobiota bacterium]|nr:sugar ABC transporter permease [Verrucomicrobiota bacterium]
MAKGNSIGDAFSLVLLLGPFLGLWLLFWLVPLLLGVDLSLQNSAWHSEAFHENQYANASKYVGSYNFQRVAEDPKFYKAVRNSTYYVVGTVLLILPLAFALALSLRGMNRLPRGVFVFCQMVPGLAMPGVLSTLFYLFFHGRTGAQNHYLIIPLGLKPINWMMDPHFILPSMILQSIWRWTGMVTLFFLCGMESVPRWQLEAARLEGAGTWLKIRSIWIPSIRNLGLFAGVFLAVDGFASFSGAYVLLGGSGGILDSGLLFVTYVYQVAFPGGGGRFDFPAAAAMSLMVAPALALLLFLTLRLRKFLSWE